MQRIIHLTTSSCAIIIFVQKARPMICLSRTTKSSFLFLNCFLVRTVVRPFISSSSVPAYHRQITTLSRLLFIGQTALLPGLSSSLSTQASNLRPISMLKEAISLLDSVYGPVEDSSFPLPMPADEAGLCANGQRRYLWTDAFGVLAFVSIAEIYEREGKTTEGEKYKRAADTLVDVVHESLGTPRSAEDGMQKDPNSTTGYVGLRIGKIETLKVTDYGMRYDGQYFHYVDKWLLALERAGRVEEGIRIAKSCFPYFFDAGRDGSGRGGGIRWKLSADATPPPSLQCARASDDTLAAMIVFSLLEKNARNNKNNRDNDDNDDIQYLTDEIGMLKTALQGYKPSVTDDPLGWGLEVMFDQFIEGQPRQQALAALSKSALDLSHLSLPFRLYGAIMGAKIGGKSAAPSSDLDNLIVASLEYETRAKARGSEAHSSINRVMLAMCLLCPGALGRRLNDPIITLDA